MAGEGSIFRRADGRWVASVSIGPRTHRHFKRRIRATRLEAMRALDQLRADQRLGASPSKQSLGDYLRRWLDDSARPAISPNTYRGYEDVLGHLEPLAAIPLDRLTPEDIEACCNAMTVRRGRAILPASPKTVRNAQVMLRRALGQAEARGHLRRNVARLVPLRRVPRSSHDALDPAVARRIVAATAGDRYAAAFLLGLCGMRQGEILGLAWDDVDLVAGRATLRYQTTGSGPRARRAPLKTARSEATIPLPGIAVRALTEHRRAQLVERAAAGRSTTAGLVFVTPRGYAVNGSWLTKHFQRLLADAGLPRMRLHDLRHGAASLLVGAGVAPRIAQELLRHSTSRVTMEIYAHVSAGQQREAADVLDEVLTG
jgi:integrase